MGPLAAGRQRFGPFELTAALDSGADTATVDVLVRNRAETPLHVESLVVGFRWREADASDLRFLRHGWQSWSLVESRALDAAGEPPFPCSCRPACGASLWRSKRRPTGRPRRIVQVG